ncbi:MAG: UDP-N-acetylmuramoyl-L-alanyl-D-glutamate--2,6-diaminopimelate ligase [Burkholderiales bacterium]
MVAREILDQLARDGAMIERLVSDSRRCAPGAAFFAWPGERVDARAHIPEAIARGAAAILWDAADFAWRQDWRVPNVGVENLRERAGEIADVFHDQPSASLWVCGVTGTNGKTSCTQWLAAALSAHGVRAGVIGTLGSGIAGERLVDSASTTPDALELHRLLAQLRHEGARAAALEVSSHGLVQARVGGVRFRCALLTNLSHDHLDYHGSMQAYADAKALLFAAPGLETAVLNLDDAFGVRIAQRLLGTGVRTIGYSLSEAAIAPGSVDEFIAARSVDHGAAGMRLQIVASRGVGEVTLAHVGRFNAANALGVLGCLLAHGLEFDAALARLEGLPPVPGRMQRLGGRGRPLAVIDYAHTPDAIEKVLQALRPLADAAHGRLSIVFGAGGDRDPSKRALMGQVASRLADRIILTSDNPRGEDPAAILAAILEGVSAPHLVEPDRARAIAAAIASSRDGDIVLVAGKGHEDYQEIEGRRLPFSDAAHVERALAAWAGT